MTPKELAQRLATTSIVINQAMDDCGKRAVELIQMGFDSKQDPYGMPWKLTKDFQRPFENRDHMNFRGSFTMAPQYLGFVIRSSHPAALFQHQGTSHGIPARPVVPDRDRGLPDRWRKDFEGTITAAIKRHLEP